MDSWFKKKSTQHSNPNSSSMNKKEVHSISSPLRTSSNSEPFQRIANNTNTTSIIDPTTNETTLRRSVNNDRTSIVSNTTDNSNVRTSSLVQQNASSIDETNDDLLAELFEQLLDSMDMKGEKRSLMRKMPKDSKWMMIKSQREREKQESINRIEGKLGKQTPEYYVKKMNDYNANLMPIKNFEGLRICLTTESVGWVKKFVYLEGLRKLSDALAVLNRRPLRKDFENLIEWEIIRSIKATLNTGYGSKEALDNPKIIYSLTFSIDSSSIITRKLVADALVYLCCSEDIVGHAYVIEGLDKLMKYRRYQHRFEGWIKSFEIAINGRGKMGSKVNATQIVREAGIERDLIDYALSNIMLVNALIEIPEQVELRINIRSQLNLCGLTRIIKMLKLFNNNLLDLQIKKYERASDLDMNEIAMNYSSSQQKSILSNINDPHDLLENLLSQTADREAYEILITILQHLMLISTNEPAQQRTYESVENVVREIVMKQNKKLFKSTYNPSKSKQGFSNSPLSQEQFTINSNTTDNFIERVDHIQIIETQKKEILELKEQIKIILKRKNELEFQNSASDSKEISSNNNEELVALRLKVKNLEKLLRMSKKTINAIQQKHTKLLIKLDEMAKEENEDGSLKLNKVYTVIQQELQLNNNNKSSGAENNMSLVDSSFSANYNNNSINNIITNQNTLFDDVELENRVLKSGLAMKLNPETNKIEVDTEMLNIEMMKLKTKQKKTNNRHLTTLTHSSSNPTMFSSFEGLKAKNFISNVSSGPIVQDYGQSNIPPPPPLPMSRHNNVGGIPPPPPPPPMPDNSNASGVSSPPPSSSLLADQLKNAKGKLTSSKSPPLTPNADLLKQAMGKLNKTTTIPPPPPPMPGQSVGAGGIPPPPPPPPPPGAFLHSMVERKESKVVSSIKMKQLQWDKLGRRAIDQTIWEQLCENDGKHVEILKEKGLFEKIEQKFKLVDKESQTLKNKKLTESDNEDRIKIIEHKRAHNISIMLGKYRQLKLRDLKQAVLDADEEVLSEVLVRQLLNFIPTKDEINELEPFNTYRIEEKVNLGKPEEFILTMMGIDYYQQRLNAIHFKITFLDTFNHLDSQIACVYEASTSLFKSELFRELMAIVLIIGNFMNGDSFRGGAFGFKVSSLPKIRDTKTTDSEVSSDYNTLINFLVDEVFEHYPHLINIPKEISSLNLACKVSFNDFIGEYNKMKSQLQQIVDDLKNINASKEFSTRINEFLSSTQKSFELMEQRYQDMYSAFSKITSCMAEDPTSISPDEFFGCFREFIVSVEIAIRHKNEKASRERRIKEIRDKKVRESLNSSPQNNSHNSDEVDEEAQGVMDALLESLKNGGDFSRRKNKEDKLKEIRKKNEARNSSVGINAQELLERMQNERD